MKDLSPPNGERGKMFTHLLVGEDEMTEEQRKGYDPKADKRRLQNWRVKHQGTMLQTNMIDRNPDSWIGLDAETSLAGITFVYRYEAEMLNQAIPGVILSLHSLCYSTRNNAHTIVVVALDNLGIGYYIDIEDVYCNSIRVNVVDQPHKGDYVLVPLSRMERRYLPTVRLHDGK